MEQNVYGDRGITDLDSLKEAIAEKWNTDPQEITNKHNDAFKPKLRRAIEVGGRHMERYWLIIIHIGISQYVFAKFGMILNS